LIRIVCIVLSIFLIVYVYLRCFAQSFDRDAPRYRYRIIDLLILTTAVAMLCGAGLVGDAVVLGLFIAYTIVFGPIWRKLIDSRVRFKPTRMCLTSAAIVSSFIVFLTAIASLVIVFAPLAIRWFPLTLLPSVLPGAKFTFLHILGDNYEDEAQLFLYGLSVGLPLNIAVGVFAGAMLGLVVESLRTPDAG
jgi:hypothetical protein